MSIDTLACLEFVLFVFVLFVLCAALIFVYMWLTEPEVLKKDVKLFKEMIRE